MVVGYGIGLGLGWGSGPAIVLGMVLSLSSTEAALEIMRLSLSDLGVSPERVVQLVEEARATLELAEDGERQDVKARPADPQG